MVKRTKRDEELISAYCPWHDYLFAKNKRWYIQAHFADHVMSDLLDGKDLYLGGTGTRVAITLYSKQAEKWL